MVEWGNQIASGDGGQALAGQVNAKSLVVPKTLIAEVVDPETEAQQKQA